MLSQTARKLILSKLEKKYLLKIRRPLFDLTILPLSVDDR